jgi:hypothetical protein
MSKNKKETIMHYRLVPGPQPYLEVLHWEVPIASAADALELVALCGENDTQCLLVHEAVLSEAFFELKTKVAGEVLQKFINYDIRTAIVITSSQKGTDNFRRMAYEANQGPHFRMFPDAASAADWLRS